MLAVAVPVPAEAGVSSALPCLLWQAQRFLFSAVLCVFTGSGGWLQPVFAWCMSHWVCGVICAYKAACCSEHGAKALRLAGGHASLRSALV